MSLNRACLIGRLGRDPTSRTTAGGGQVVSFSLATDETWRDKATGEKRQRVQWHQITIFNEGLGRIAEKYLRKGDQCYLEGQVEYREYEKDGVKRYATDIVLRPYAGELKLLGGKGSPRPDPLTDPDAGARPAGDAYARAVGARTGGADLDDDIPF